MELHSNEEDCNKLIEQINITFLIWESLENFVNVLQEIAGSDQYKSIDFYPYYLLSQGAFLGILSKLRALINDNSKDVLSLRRILLDESKKDKSKKDSNKIYEKILKGEFEDFLKELKEDINTLKNILEDISKILGTINTVNLESLMQKIVEIENLPQDNSSFLYKQEEVKRIKKRLIEEKKEELPEVLQDIQGIQDIEKRINDLITEKYLSGIEKLNLNKNFDDFPKNSYSTQLFWDHLSNINNINQDQKEFIDNINNELKQLKFLDKKIQEIMEKLPLNTRRIYKSLVFKEVWAVTNKLIAHFSKDHAVNNLYYTLNSKEIKTVINDVTTEILGSLLNTNIISLTPIYQGNYFTAFMVPWLRPSFDESKTKTVETISFINKNNEENKATITLSTPSHVFFIDFYPPNYIWENGDEVAVFWSYNPQNPQQAYVMCNFSKKQCLKGIFADGSNGPWFLPPKN